MTTDPDVTPDLQLYDNFDVTFLPFDIQSDVAWMAMQSQIDGAIADL